MNLTPNDLKKGVVFSFEGQLYEVLEYRQTVLGRQSATVSVKARNLQTRKLWSHTFTGAETIEAADLRKLTVQFLYSDQRRAHFMDTSDYQQYSLELTELAEQQAYLVAEQTATLYLKDGQPLKLDLPKNVYLKVVEAPTVVKGDTSGDLTKEVRLETGLRVKTPAFIKTGDFISVDTSTGTYRERRK